ncbi:carboxypeptidase regulatory-like domain-containing protein [Parvicella tangerina]|uniref:Peptidoglycan-associated lipoprotein n=1 Tax=Parvicella tangerina TaxID=2829795 RepID=A0A916N8V4_9FLAO|nr:carboxypeptidase regulatory-like domain-containing protein [Parvicella tangerina]CAG5077699.1 Peptidoglycan-associated lipoprotein [Parvicella tangerina]
MRALLVGIVILLGCSGSYSQAESIVADHLFDNFEYEEAIHYYLRADELSLNQEQNLAYSYYAIKDYKNAAERYKTIVEQEEDLDPILYYLYGNSLRNSFQYDAAKTWLSKAYQLDTTQHFIAVALNSIDLLRSEMTKEPTLEALALEGVNNGASTYSPQWYKDGFLFCSEFKIDSAKGRPMVDVGGYGNVDKLNYGLAERPFSRLYYVEMNGFEVAKSELIAKDEKYHISSFYVSDDQIYFTKIDVNKSWDPSLRNHPRIFEGTLNSSEKSIDDPKRTPIRKLSNEVGSGHPFLTSDGKTMFFSSDRPGGFGGADLYRTTLGDDGKWSEPENLGPKINSEGDELYPNINGDDFYFSSDGLPGYGGLDIFTLPLAQLESADPVLLEAPVNSVADDYGLIIHPDNQDQGFFTSNRYGGKGDDDLYLFRLKLDGIFVQGVVKDINGDPVANALVKIYDDEGNEVAQVKTDESGRYIMELEEEGSYEVVATIPGYGDKEQVTIDDDWDNYTEVEMNLEPMLTAQGIVRNEDGSPAGNVEVTLKDDAGNIIYSGKTDEDGYYQFPLEEDRTYTALASDGLLSGEETFTTDENYDPLEDTDIVLTSGTFVEGVVLDEDGNPVSGAEVKLYDDEGNLIASTVSDENGEYHFNLKNDENYQIVATTDGFEAVENIYTGENYNSDDKLTLNLEPVGTESFALVEDNDSKEGNEGVKVTLIDNETGKKFVTTTDSDGKFTIKIRPDKSYSIHLEKEGYFPKTVKIKAGELPDKVDLNQMGDFGMDYAGYEVKRIYFELDEYTVTPESADQLDKIVTLLKANPKAVITVKSYADCRGPAKYNVSLSWKRSKAVRDYLKDKGVSTNRILTESYGATNFVNNCSTPEACSESEHALNRRSEFEIDFNK